MGDVYRAYDTTLGTVVALKIPPRDHPEYSVLKGLLPGEVRLAHRVSHPNVCRVFDLVIEDQLLMLSMEHIDGETLDEILRARVEPLSWSVRLRIAHEICAGLAAIHDRGLIHRDLKPANVMVDSQGRTVILDLGLAAEAGVVFDRRSGTNVYMAPEQTEGGEVTYKADLFALGLVLYELFTGKHPYPSTVREDLMEMQERGLPLSGDRDRTREAALAAQILRCVDENPDERPLSAKEVGEALPGEPLDHFRDTSTPVYWLLVEPEGGLGRRAAWTSLAATLLGLVLVALLSQWSQPTQVALSGEPPAELAVRAQQVVTRLGFDGTRSDRRSGFTYEPDLERPVRFWYRQSPRRITPWRKGSAFHHYRDPPFSRPGDVGVHLDPQGRIVRLDAVGPGAGRGPSSEESEPNALLTAAGLDRERLRPTEPVWIPPVFADRRWAWETRGPEPVRVEAATLEGRPVTFRLVESGPIRPRGMESVGDEPGREEGGQLAGPGSDIAFSLWFALALVGAAWLARRKLRSNIADRPAAFRLALFVFAVRSLAGLLCAQHLLAPSELDIGQAVLARGLLAAAFVWVIYIAVEPWVRLFSPEGAASWIRLLYGRPRDPLVGRDLQIGGLFGVAALLWVQLYAIVPGELGLPSPRVERLSPLLWMIGQQAVDLQCQSLAGLRQTLGMATYALVHAVLVGFFAVTGMVLLRQLLRRPWLSRSTAFLLFLLLTFPAAGQPGLDLLAAAVSSLLWLGVLLRFGFLSAVTATAFTWLLSSHPLTLDPTSWAFPGALVPLLLTLGISVWGFRASLGDHSPLPVGLFRLRQQTG